MNKPKSTDNEYVDFLIGTQLSYSCLEASKVQPEGLSQPRHDAINRLLYRIPPDSNVLWEEAKPHVTLNDGLLLIDDSTLDKPFARAIELVGYHWSGHHHRAVKGINLQSLIWTSEKSYFIVDQSVFEIREVLL